jgi:energy-coupling factor transporter ATP-binding protein EcfA2
MRIEKIHISEKTAEQFGLKEINVTKKPLGAVVALIGKNGAGKSRILNQVRGYISNIEPAEKFVLGHITNFPQGVAPNNYKASLANIKNDYDQYLIQNDENHKLGLIGTIRTHTRNLFSGYEQRVSDYVKVIDTDDLSKIKAGISNQMTFNQILSNAHFTQPNQQQQRLSNEFTAFNTQATVKYFNDLSTQIVKDEYNLFIKHKDMQIIGEQLSQKESYLLFNKFKDYVIRFLGKEFSYNAESGNAISSTLLFDDKPFNIEQLSPGQKTLFAYAILFFYLDVNTKANMKDSIIIIDEPERHLHPGAQIKLLDALRSIISDSGQLWIATHSVHLLSHLEYDEILMVKDNEIVLPSRTTPGNTFNELMEIEPHIFKLTEFVNSISDWAFGNFMAQCLREPDTVFGTDNQDSQYLLFKKFLSEKSNIKLLDFGAGKGRIGHTISEDDELKNKVMCFAYEPYESNLNFLKQINRYAVIYDKLSSIKSNEHDCVLLCGVLHEINPKSWVECLTSIKNSLSDDGFLVIIEDKMLPKGECAHEYGYLIFGEKQLKILFNITEKEPLSIHLNINQENERLLFFAIKKEAINVTEDNIIAALESLKESSFTELQKLRGPSSDVSIGRTYANQTQLYINATLALKGFEELKKERNRKLGAVVESNKL